MKYVLNSLKKELAKIAVKSDIITLSILYEQYLKKEKDVLKNNLIDGKPLFWFNFNENI